MNWGMALWLSGKMLVQHVQDPGKEGCKEGVRKESHGRKEGERGDLCL